MRFPKHTFFVVILLVITNLIFANNSPSNTLDTVYLQLKWKHQFQFAGYYAAIEKGFYKDQGLHVIILEAIDGSEAIPSVVKNKAQYGIATSDLLISRNIGQPVVLLANIFQHSPHIFLTSSTDDGDNIHDLSGKSIMLEEHAAELLAYLKSENIPTETMSFVPHTFDPNSLIHGDVFAMSAYSTDEPFLLKEQNIKYNIYNPRSSGIDFYGDVLFTSENEVNNHPERVKSFLSASLDGWKYALENDDEIVQLIYNKYSQRHSVGHLKFEAEQTKRLIMDDVVEIGYVNPNRWQRIGEIYSELRMLTKNFKMDGFVYERNPKPDNRLAYLIVSVIVIISLIISYVAIRFYKLNRKLEQESKEKAKTEKQLRIAEEQFRNLAEFAPFPLFITTPEKGEILYLNQRACEKFEIIRELALQRNITDFYVESKNRDDLIDRLKKQGFVKNKEFHMQTAGDNKFWAIISSNIINFQENTAMFSAILDITERIELETELKSANTDKDQLFSIIAHDLKGPIGNLVSLIEVLIDNKNTLDVERKDKILNLLRDSSRTTYVLLENLLLWALAQKDELQYLPKMNHLTDIIENNTSLFSADAENKKITITHNCDPHLNFRFDTEMINAVIRNLINNAVKFTNEGGSITINARIKKNELLISVEDNGIGIEEKILSQIFKVKAKTHLSIGTKGEKGTGLGLLLCSDFIKKHNGKIWVESTIGEGSKFYFSIP